MKRALHVIISLLIAALIMLLPLLLSGYGDIASLKKVDAVSSASTILDEPSGEYVVFINSDRHRDAGKLGQWLDFFAGKDAGYIFEDIDCMAAKNDSLGIEAAGSFVSRLPQNQMTLRLEEPVMMLSKAEYGKYDIIVISREAADIYNAWALLDDDRTMEIINK